MNMQYSFALTGCTTFIRLLVIAAPFDAGTSADPGQSLYLDSAFFPASSTAQIQESPMQVYPVAAPPLYVATANCTSLRSIDLTVLSQLSTALLNSTGVSVGCVSMPPVW